MAGKAGSAASELLGDGPQEPVAPLMMRHAALQHAAVHTVSTVLQRMWRNISTWVWCNRAKTWPGEALGDAEVMRRGGMVGVTAVAHLHP